MKKIMVLALGAAFLLSSCGSYTATGAYTGSTLGSVLGSAIGGLSGGPRGSDWGQIIGMAGGAVIGGAIGNAADKAQERKIERYHDRVLNKYDNQYAQGDEREVSGFDPSNSADDRIEFDGKAPSSDTYHVPATVPEANISPEQAIQISNVRFEDNDNILRANERSKIAFEVRNVSKHTIFHVMPNVVESTGNKHIVVSPGIEVESIAPGSGIKYTANVVADKKLNDGQATFKISVEHGNRTKAETSQVINVVTRR